MISLPELPKSLVKNDNCTKNRADSIVIHVYHIVKADKKYDLDEGYIGVTTNIERRKSQHFSALREGEHVNYKLQTYFNQNSDNILFYIYKSFPKEFEKQAYQLEEFLRPLPNIGLNISVGGVKQHEDIFKAKKYSKQINTNSRSTNLFKAMKDGIKSIDKSIANLAEESLKKSQVRETHLQKELEKWESEQEQRLNKRIGIHLLKRRDLKLTTEQQNAVDEWKNQSHQKKPNDAL
ncbi:GIY-YIG nuclease family protein [Vibrio sp. F74]|uniref:GIY-YIG nuclease family protein n=1 Tax=Vibrio sp. F74 TaxID=700020 RepID=UPI0035F551F7